MPAKTLVMDIGLTRSGEYKVVEWNCIHCSGYYNSNVGSIIDKLMKIWG